MVVKAVLFDLDGVITDTAKYHFKAWQYVANDYQIQLKPEFEEELKGIDRVNSLKKILKLKNLELPAIEFEKAISKKNQYYLSLLANLKQDDILPGILSVLKELKRLRIKVIIASVSQNAPYIISKLKIDPYIDAIADPKAVENTKPAPDIFILAAQLAKVSIEECVAVEDSQAGIDAINAAGIFSIGIGRTLEKTNLLLSTTNQLTIKQILNKKK